MDTKICTKCKVEYPATLEYFSKSKYTDGLKSMCKKCRNEYGKRYRERNKEKLQSKEYKEEMKEYCKDYYSKNRDKLLERAKKDRKENKQRIKKWKEKNEEKIKEYVKRYREENKDRIRIVTKMGHRRYYLNNKQKCIMNRQKRKAIKKQLPHTLTLKQWKCIKLKFNNKCAYCGEEKQLEQEHFIPVSKGGEYTKNNIIPSCKRCNSSKNNSDFFIWYPKQEFYSKERERFILKYLGYKDDKQQLKLI